MAELIELDQATIWLLQPCMILVNNLKASATVVDDKKEPP